MQHTCIIDVNVHRLSYNLPTLVSCPFNYRIATITNNVVVNGLDCGGGSSGRSLMTTSFLYEDGNIVTV